MKLKELIEEWLFQNHKDEIKPRTFMRYECSYRTNILPYYGNIDIEEITARDIQRWINELKNKISPKTGRLLSPSSINTVLLILKLSYNYAVDFEITKHNPTLKVKGVSRIRNSALRVFTREEQIRIERYIDRLNDDEYFVYILTLYTGVRLGEVTALTWKDINLKTGIMSINKSKYKLIRNIIDLLFATYLWGSLIYKIFKLIF